MIKIEIRESVCHYTIQHTKYNVFFQVLLHKQDLEGVEQTGVLTHDGIQYGTYFDHGYGTVTVDTSTISAVDLQMLNAALNAGTENPTHILTAAPTGNFC